MTLSVLFAAHDPVRVLGRATLEDGRLVSESAGVQNIIDGKCRALDMSGLQAAEFFASWSNGYIGSSLEGDPDGETLAALVSRPTRTVGIDLASTPRGTAVVAIEWGARAVAEVVCHPTDGSAATSALLEVLASEDRIGVDCPFGWPTDFVDAVVAHHAREPWPGGPDVVDRRTFRLRATDRHLSDVHGVSALSVSADRIGSVAMRWASLLSSHERSHGPVDRTGNGRVVEVYPALAARRWGLRHQATAGYRTDLDARRAMLDELSGQTPRLSLDEDFRAAVDEPSRGHDVVDALLAALVAAAASTPGGCEEPPAWDSDAGRRASVEGWIAVPKGPLSALAPQRGPFFRSV